MNKASGGDEIPVELFQILKDDAVKVLPKGLRDLEIDPLLLHCRQILYHLSHQRGPSLPTAACITPHVSHVPFPAATAQAPDEC